jgi:GNAT superfamily N-acetyltransferase
MARPQRNGDVSVRPAEPEHAEVIAAIHVRSWRATYAETVSTAALEQLDVRQRQSLWRQRLTNPPTGHLTLVGEGGGRVVGFLLLGPTPDADHDPATTGQVLAVHVDPEVTGGGIGAALMKRAVEILAGSGYLLATLWVVDQNLRARRFYERLGWVHDGTSRIESLAVEQESGDDVRVVRYQLQLRAPGGNK